MLRVIEQFVLSLQAFTYLLEEGDELISQAAATMNELNIGAIPKSLNSELTYTAGRRQDAFSA